MATWETLKVGDRVRIPHSAFAIIATIEEAFITHDDASDTDVLTVWTDAGGPWAFEDGTIVEHVNSMADDS